MRKLNALYPFTNNRKSLSPMQTSLSENQFDQRAEPYTTFSPFFLSFQTIACVCSAAKLLMSPSTALFRSGSLKPFPSAVLNSHHWIIDYLSPLWIGFIEPSEWWCCSRWSGRAPQLSYSLTNICLFFNLPRDFLRAVARSKPFDICQDCQMACACVCVSKWH